MPVKPTVGSGRKREPSASAKAKPAPSASKPSLTKKQKHTQSARAERWWSWWLAAIVVAFGLIRLRLLSLPLERDEGEYAYAGQLIAHALVPYRYCYTMKLPGTAAVYALLTALFGQTASGVHLGLIVVNSATTALVYLLAKRLFGRLAGVTAAAAFAFLSLEPGVLGVAGHATQFVVLPAVGGVLSLVKAIEDEKSSSFFWSGIAFGVAFLMKQPGIFFFLFAAFFLAYSERISGVQWRRLAFREMLLWSGFAIPFAVTCLIMLRAGTFQKFWFWTFSYASEYAKGLSLSGGWQNFEDSLGRVTSSILMWIVAAIGAVALLADRKTRSQSVMVLGFFAFSFAAVCPGLYFRPHYFVLLLPAVSLLCGIAVSRATSLIQESKAPSLAGLPCMAFAVALGICVFQDREFFFFSDPIVACRTLYGANPFPEAEKIAEFIRGRAAPNDRIAVIGSEPEIYFYSKLRSATGYIYTYPLMEPQPFASTMQHDMEREIESAKPRFVVNVNVPTSWLRYPESDVGIIDWASEYVKADYQLVGVVDLTGSGTEFYWDDDAKNHKLVSPFNVWVYQTK